LAVTSVLAARAIFAQAPATPAAGDQTGRGRGQAAGDAAGQGRGGAPGGRGGRGAAASAPVESKYPDLAGIWNGGGGARPVNSENYPWTKENFPVLNERGQAYVKVFDEAIAPKYDCVPSSSPAIQYDPYYMQLVQWPDRVIFRYEKDDQTRTAWLDGRKPTIQDYNLQGFSVGRYEGDALIVTTDHFLFDITGFDDYNGIPSSSLKKVTERYWKENGELKLTLTLEDPLMLRQPASYTTRWLPARPGYQLEPWDCDPETARAPIKMMVPKYK
jgi:hypothetical protein